MNNLDQNPPVAPTRCVQYPVLSLSSLCLKSVLLRTPLFEAILNDGANLSGYEGRIEVLPVPAVIKARLKRMARELVRWDRKHSVVLPTAGYRRNFLLEEVIWDECSSIDDVSTAHKLIRIWRSGLTQGHLETAFRIACVYCFSDVAIDLWNRFPVEISNNYMADSNLDPITIFWTGMCGGRPWLSDSYLVRAFYSAAQNNYLEAFRHFWTIISQDRQEAVNFRCTRAFQLASMKAHMDIMSYLWNATTATQQEAMIQALLQNTTGSICAFECAAQSGFTEIITFLFRVADYQQRVIMLRADDCGAFRSACTNGHTEIVRAFMTKAKRYDLVSVLLQSDWSSAFYHVLQNGPLEMLKILWDSTNRTEKLKLLNDSEFQQSIDIPCYDGHDGLDYLWSDIPRTDTELVRAFLEGLIVPNVVNELSTSLKDTKPPSKDMFAHLTPTVTGFVEKLGGTASAGWELQSISCQLNDVIRGLRDDIASFVRLCICSSEKAIEME